MQTEMQFMGEPSIKLLGIHGPDKGGKSSLAQAARNLEPSVQILSVASSIKQKAATDAGVDLAEIQRDKEKFRGLLRSTGASGRSLHGKRFWLDQLEARYASVPSDSIVIVDDIRKAIEADWIREQGGAVISLYRVGECLTAGEMAEQLLEDIDPDLIIWNDFSKPISQLETAVKSILWGTALDQAMNQLQAG